MADQESQHSSDYDGDDEENDKFLVDYFRKTPENELFRPTLADEQKIGFFSLDRACQTEESEIIDLKQMTSVIAELTEDAAKMKRDINFARHVMEADFESKLQQKSIELYCRVNDQIGEIEKLHAERVATVRRAFKQQLSDAISRMHTYYNSQWQTVPDYEVDVGNGQAASQDRNKTVAKPAGLNAYKDNSLLKSQMTSPAVTPRLGHRPPNQHTYRSIAQTRVLPQQPKITPAMKSAVDDIEKRLNKEQNRKEASSEKWEQKVKELQATVQRNESVIEMLKLQLSQYQKEDDEMEEPEKPPSRTESVIAEIDGLRDEIGDYQEKVKKLERTLNQKERVLDDTKTELNSRLEDLEKERIVVEQIRSEMQELQNAAESDKAAGRRHMEGQRLALQQEMEDKMRMAREEALSNARKEAEAMQDSERDKIRQLMDEKKEVEKLLAQERAKANVKSQDSIDLERTQRNETKLLAEVTKQRKEIERIHKTWEKKFAILQQSLHALKDESFLRQTLQRQAAQLHQASISYAYDAPVGITPTRPPNQHKPSVPIKKPLPHIKGGKSPAPDYISYTISAGSGRATAVMQLDENQVMSGDEQELPPEFVPLPSPPPQRSMSDCGAEQNNGNDSRPSTRSHVVVLPSVEAQ